MVSSDIQIDLSVGLRGQVRVWMQKNGTDVTVRFYTFAEQAQEWINGKPDLLEIALQRALVKIVRQDPAVRSIQQGPNWNRLIDPKTGCHLIMLSPRTGYGQLRIRLPLPTVTNWEPVFEELKQDQWVPAAAELRQAALQEALVNTILRQHWEA